jgi:hypothetical protein
VLAFFWHPGVINDQGLDRTALPDDGQHTGAHRGEYCVVGPVCVFRRIPAGYSDAKQPVIPTEASH